MSRRLPSSHTLRVYESIVDTIGHTPLVHLQRIGRGLPCPIYAKVEFFNPGGSVKDRIGAGIIQQAESSGALKPGGTVVESTSGNTGVGLAIVCALKGYKSVFVMPDKMSQEKIQLLRAFGARVVITPTAVAPEDPRSYYNVAKQIVQDTPNAILANQYHNPENPRSHYLSTGPEIWEQTGGAVTDLVATMGTGGTITGTGRYLKEQNPSVRVIGVDPVGSILLDTWKNGGSIPANIKAAPYKVEGFGEDFIPTTLDLTQIDDVLQVTDQESFLWARRLVREEGIFAGGSAGSAVSAAVRHARGLPPQSLVVVLLPDSGSRYLSKIYDDKWMRENGYLRGAWAEAPLSDALASKPIQGLISACTDDRISDVITRMKENNISQLPALLPDGSLAGLVTEVNLLKHMINGASAEESISAIVQQPEAVFTSTTPMQAAMPALMDGSVVLVTEGEKPVGILTKIDVLDYIAKEL